MKALIIEDDNEIVESIELALQMSYPEMEMVTTHLGERALEMREAEEPDIVILDLGLPDISGFEVLKQIRAKSSVPIIILTVKSAQGDIAKGLQWGANDYVIKPCGQMELVARIKARLRGNNRYDYDLPITLGLLQLNPVTHEFIIKDKPVRLTAIETQVMQCLMKNEGRVATYSIIAEDVWGDDCPGTVDSLRVHIRRLREKIEDDPANPQVILTKTGIGYAMGKAN